MDDEIRILKVRLGMRRSHWVVTFSRPLRMADGTPDTHVLFPSTVRYPDRLAAIKWALEQIEIHHSLTS